MGRDDKVLWGLNLCGHKTGQVDFQIRPTQGQARFSGFHFQRGQEGITAPARNHTLKES